MCTFAFSLLKASVFFVFDDDHQEYFKEKDVSIRSFVRNSERRGSQDTHDIAHAARSFYKDIEQPPILAILTKLYASKQPERDSY
jgi:hypothetical protein